MKTTPHRLVLAIVALAAAPRAARAEEPAAGAAGATRVLHVPPAEADGGQPLLIDTTITGAWRATLELHYRRAGEAGWHAVGFERTSEGLWRAAVPAEDVQAPGVEYYIAGVGEGGQASLHFASAAAPHRVAVHEDRAAVVRAVELERAQGRRARVRVAIETVDFGARDITTQGGEQYLDRRDDYVRVDADFGYRLLRHPLHTLRFGYTYLLGHTPATTRDDGSCDPDFDDGAEAGTPTCSGQAGFKVAGWFETRLRVSALVDVDLRAIVAATKEDFTLGGRTELRIGSELGSHVALGAESIAAAGSTFFVRLGWDTVPRFPMAATIELSDLPSAHRATAVRLVYDVSYPMPSGLRLGLRAGYQARDAGIGGLALGSHIALDF